MPKKDILNFNKNEPFFVKRIFFKCIYYDCQLFRRDLKKWVQKINIFLRKNRMFTSQIFMPLFSEKDFIV